MAARISVGVRYHNILRRQAGVLSETVSLAPGTTLHQALEELATRHGPQLREMLFSPEGDIASHLVVFCNGKLVHGDRAGFGLQDGHELMLFPATSGG
ncbi:MAG TPA: MoaD/ThiS family protein [Anaerolineae bacterium]|nr:MoaD/ThiS family protein [Anaerolineae bacterium]